MFWRAARGRVGPNFRSVLHMAIFLLNPYGLCSCILVPKCSPGARRRPSFGRPRWGRICQSVLDFRSVLARAWRSTSSPGRHMALHPTFLALATLAPNPEHHMPIGSRCACIKRKSKCGHLTFIKKYDIIFKKRVCVRWWRLSSLTTLKKCDIINKKTSTADRS